MNFFNDDGKKGWFEKGRNRWRVRDELAILPLRNTVIYPGVVIPLTIGRESSLCLLEEALEGDKIIGIMGQKDPQVDEPDSHQLFSMGTIAQILRILKVDEDSNNLVAHVQGIHRFSPVEYTQKRPYMKAHVKLLEDSREDDLDSLSLFKNLQERALRIVELSPHIPQEVAVVIQHIESPGYLADLVTAYLNVSIVEKQQILECLEVKSRLQKVLVFVAKELQMLELNYQIQNQVKGELDKSQREYYLRKQLKTIKKELGEEEEELEELEELRLKLKQVGMPSEVEKDALKELSRLTRIPIQSAEYTVSRSYLDWLGDLPWSNFTGDSLDIVKARHVLHEDHFGLEKIKKRILQYLAVCKLKNNMKGPILCFVGPPGVGKTSLGRSIARAMGRNFVRVALGGVKDESEIRGHRRTYVGALPGRIIQGIKKAKSNNPVFVLDEIDKLANDVRGGPASALLEVLDPEQNHAFSDHYLEVPFDLSKVMFIATANQLEPIPPALRDRMEIIELSGYTEDEKLSIAKRYLLSKQQEEHGLQPEHVTMPESVLRNLIHLYTREAGVRSLERQIASVRRCVAMNVVEGQTEKVEIDESLLSEFLGPARHFSEIASRTNEIGVATGLAWTSVGGEILFVEATKMKGKGQLILTGQLGEVMKESAKTAYSYLRAKAVFLGISEDVFEKNDLHIHVPAGSIPKDGPSAGVAIYSAMVSLFLRQRIHANIAMTGEISLRGVILPVGGVKEKVLAAQRSGVTSVLLPQRNQKDLHEIPDEIKESIEIHFLSHLDELPSWILEKELRASLSQVSTETQKLDVSSFNKEDTNVSLSTQSVRVEESVPFHHLSEED